MPDYKNSKIYKIVSPSNPDLIYYGSTIQSLSSRMSGHRTTYRKYIRGEIKYYIRAYDILKYEDAIILLVENFSCNNKEELHKKEGEYILNNDCVNKNVAGRKLEDRMDDHNAYQKKYREQNKEKIKNYYEEAKEERINKEYQRREQNKEAYKEYQKQYRLKNKEKLSKYMEKYMENYRKT
jgi:hypothetical protein